MEPLQRDAIQIVLDAVRGVKDPNNPYNWLLIQPKVNAKAGVAAMAAVGKIDRNHEGAGLVIRVAVAISKADGELSPLEARAISDICGTLSVPLPSET